MRRILPDDKWRAEKLATLPAAWSRKLEQRIQRTLSKDNSGRTNFEVNTLLRETSEHLEHCVLPANATDADVNDHAAACARKVRDILALPLTDAMRMRSLDVHCIDNRVAPPNELIVQSARVARMLDAHWWRRGLRRAQARDIEGAAIKLGFVHAHAEKYVSNESLTRVLQQRRRNRRMLESVTMKNEKGDEFSLARLSDKTVANPELRRGEMMLRIRGFEEIARERGDSCLFVTLTCPSRYHAKLQSSGEFNPHYDGSTPSAAQNYLRTVWSRIRSSLHRKGIAVYGFRIAEPHHDGCPHWHLLLFVPRNRGESDQLPSVRQVVERHALADNGDERGAQERRVRFETIDLTSGSAAGYVAKYISKAVGVGVEVEETNRGAAAATRVPAWASTHGIRQFQQIGGAPVGLWRELRKVPYEALGKRPPKALAQSWQAANRKDDQKCDFAAFLAATGGVTIKRKNRKLRIAWEWSDKEGKYGEPLGFQPVGVSLKNSPKIYASVRHDWTIVAPWTRVNNCTVAVAQKIGNDRGENTVKDLNHHPPPELFNYGTSHPRINPKIQSLAEHRVD